MRKPCPTTSTNLLLRRHGHHLGINAEGIISLITSSLRLAGASRRFPNSRTIFGFLSAAVNKNCSIDEAIEQDKSHLIQFADDFYLILQHYTEFKSKHSLLTESSAAQEVCARFSHVLVDEYQDANALQAMIVTALSSVHRNLFVVGDDAQGIYSFRGADSQNILRFPDNRPGCAVITLEENYRSPPQVLAFTNAVIANMREKFAKRLFTVLPDGPEAASLRRPQRGRRGPLDHRQNPRADHFRHTRRRIAVLYRQGPHAYKFELELLSSGLVFEKWGGLKLTESAQIKDVTACHGTGCCCKLTRSARKRLRRF